MCKVESMVAWRKDGALEDVGGQRMKKRTSPRSAKQQNAKQKIFACGHGDDNAQRVLDNNRAQLEIPAAHSATKWCAEKASATILGGWCHALDVAKCYSVQIVLYKLEVVSTIASASGSRTK